ncbi:MAG TPA: hypothetical protein VFA26_17595, partial [Gemmataceae bacterium]|nr:hypothetical protein [Gemmataceae bacterium]
MRRSHWRHPVLAILALPLLAGGLLAGDGQQPAKAVVGFGVLQAPSDEEAKAQALAWLRSAGRDDEQSLRAFEAAWQGDRLLLDRVADTLALGNAEAARLLREARDPGSSAPQAVPALLRDAKQPVFFRANLALAYARALSNRRVYEEALEVLQGVRPEQVVDPAAYLFHRAVCEHGLMKGEAADATLARLLDDVADAPERYRRVALLMHFDVQNWREKDLGWIKRKMDNIERRLDLARGGPRT